jgi:hypothetical protein
MTEIKIEDYSKRSETYYLLKLEEELKIELQRLKDSNLTISDEYGSKEFIEFNLTRLQDELLRQ